MKTIIYLTFTVLFIFNSCHSKKNPAAQNASFGLYETVRILELPVSLFDSIKVSNIKPQLDKSLPVIGYLTNEDFVKFQSEYSRSSLRFLKTVNTVDPADKYYAVVAVRYPSVIGNADIQKAKNEDMKVILHFNRSGARKWADMTKNNIGNTVAIVINDQIYSMPIVNGEIKNGTALIDGFKDPSSAREMSASLNTSLPQ